MSVAHFNVKFFGDQDKADRAARIDAQVMADNDLEICPCPQCGWVQKSMISSVARRDNSNLYCWSIAYAFVSLALLTCVGYLMHNHGVNSFNIVGLGFVVLFFVLPGIAVWITWKVRQTNSKINADFDGLPRPVPGAMPSLNPLLDQHGQTIGYEIIHPAEPVIKGLWIHVCIPLMKFPDVCSECLSPADEATTLNFGMLPVHIDICWECESKIKSRLKRNKRLWSISLAVAMAPSCGLLAYLSGGNMPVMVISIVGGVILGFLTGLGAAKSTTGPSVDIKVISKTRGIGAIRADNPKYHQMLVHQAGLGDMLETIDTLPIGRKSTGA